MNFTTTSEMASSRPVVAECQDLNLVYRLRLIRLRTLRDIFVNVTKNPVEFLLKKTDRLHVLKNINLKIYKGDRIGILGFNGAGKTSLCRCFAKVYAPAKGRVLVQGRTRAIFDTSVGVYPELTGRENAQILAKFMYPEVTDAERDRLVSDAIEFSELGPFADAPYKTYSNGMQARLCLSIVSCKSPDLLILDEVFDGADKFFREKIAGRIVQLIANAGAVLFVSHAPEQIQQVCNRVIVIHNRVIAFDGDVKSGVEFYNSLRSPQQFGQMVAEV